MVPWGGGSLCPGPPAAWGDSCTPVTLGMSVLGALSSAFSCAFWQSEEDKQLQDELEMLVERLGVSLCCAPQQGAVEEQSPGQDLNPSVP